jgi:hypothetical protein
MSTFQAIALILVTMISGIHVGMGITRVAWETAHAIVIGVYQGLPLSIEHRWLILWNFYVSTMLTGASLAGAAALAFVQVGKHVADPALRNLAYLLAGGWSLISLLWLLGGINGVIYMVSVLRKTKRA